MMPIQKYGRVVTIALVVVAALAFGSARADAAILTATDGNSSMCINDSVALGMNSWIVDGQSTSSSSSGSGIELDERAASIRSTICPAPNVVIDAGRIIELSYSR